MTEGGADMPADVPADEPPMCSAKGCRAEAAWVLAWNNPKLHTPERRKAWATCEQHREQLAHFLALRGFLRETVPLEQWDAGQSSPASAE
jgi:hypothetical protein